jgi:hypothetical protein
MRLPLKARRLRLLVKSGTTVSALYKKAPRATALLVLAHGAGAGMSHPFIAAVADLLAEAGISTLRFQFPYMEAGAKWPDRPASAHAAIRAAVQKAAKLAPDLPLFAGGKSFGGRMTSQAQALEPLPNVRGLLFLGFPLHTPESPRLNARSIFSTSGFPNYSFRARGMDCSACAAAKGKKRLGKRATFWPVKDADRSFGVLVRSGRNHRVVLSEIAEVLGKWIRARKLASRPTRPRGKAES